jgi:hypothetical protein
MSTAVEKIKAIEDEMVCPRILPPSTDQAESE